MTGKAVYVTTDYREKQLQRALLQYRKPENANMVREALRLAGREDLIGNSPECLVRPAFGQGESSRYIPEKGKTARGGKKSNASGANRNTKNNVTRTVSGKKTKLDRIFGDDSARIKREAARLSDEDKRRGKGAKPTGTRTAKSGGYSAKPGTHGTKPTSKSHTAKPTGRANPTTGKPAGKKSKR
jgi:hypothetical protein